MTSTQSKEQWNQICNKSDLKSNNQLSSLRYAGKRTRAFSPGPIQGCFSSRPWGWMRSRDLVWYGSFANYKRPKFPDSILVHQQSSIARMIFGPYPRNNAYPASTRVWLDEVFVLAVILASFTEIPALKGEDPVLGQGLHKSGFKVIRTCSFHFF